MMLQLQRQNASLVPAQVVPRLDLGSVIIAHPFSHTTRIMDALNVFLMMSVKVNTSLHHQGQITASFVS